MMLILVLFFFFSSRRRHTRYWRDWSSDVCSSDLYFGDASGGFHTDQGNRPGQPPPRPARRAAARLGVAWGHLALRGRGPGVPAVVGVEVVGHRRGVPYRPAAVLVAAPRPAGERRPARPRYSSVRLWGGGSLSGRGASAAVGWLVCG